MKDLDAKIRAFDGWNERAQPFVWAKTASEIDPQRSQPPKDFKDVTLDIARSPDQDIAQLHLGRRGRPMTLTADEYERILNVLNDLGDQHSTSAFSHTLLESLARRLGYRSTTYMPAPPPRDVNPDNLGDVVAHGIKAWGVRAWLSGWRHRDVWASRPAQACLERQGIATIPDIARTCAPGDLSGWMDDFLKPLGLGSQLVCWIPTGSGRAAAFLSLHRDRSTPFDAHDVAVLAVLRRQLSNVLWYSKDGANDHGVPLWSRLSDREQQVATAVADGATNKAAAAQLFVCEDTIKKHLMHIFQKLEVSSRAELAAGFSQRARRS